MNSTRTTPASVQLLLGMLLGAMCAFGTVRAENPAAQGGITGTWYLALNAEVFDLPPGSTLPGLVQFHTDRTLTIVDAGDLGTAPFPTKDTAQMGHWSRERGRIHTLTLFLQQNESNGDVGWNKVEIELSRPTGDVMEGWATVSYLGCNTEVPFPVFFCPDPVDNILDFDVVPPSNIPVRLTRLPAP